MDSWTTPSDSPIWSSLNNSHPNLALSIRQRVFILLQECEISPTDKIFPWVVETIINRVSMESLADKLDVTQEELKSLPSEISQTVRQSLSMPITSIQSSQVALESLTVELRKNSVIEASLKSSGWRGVICALEAITKHQALGVTVGAIALLSALMSGAFVWGLGSGDRQFIQFNKQTFKNCYEKYAVDQDRNGWFSCPGVQLPMK